MVGVRTSRKPYCRYWVRRNEMSLLMTWVPLGRKSGEPGLYVDELKSSWLVPRARWSFGGIEGAWVLLGRPLAASAHEHWRDVVDESHCVRAEGHCSGRVIAGREMRRGRSRVTARMVVLRRTVLLQFSAAVLLSIRTFCFLRPQLAAIAQLSYYILL